MLKRLQLLMMVILVSSATLFAGGFQINEAGARAMAMAGAFTGLANDASAIFFNPAGITQLEGTHITAGTTLILPNSKFTGFSDSSPLVAPEAEYEMESQVFTPINFYITQQLTDDLFVGFGVYNPYGLGTKWADTWVGRYAAVDTEVRTFFFNPVVAYKVSDALSISAGFVFGYGDVKIIKNLFLADPVTSAPKADAQTALEGDGTAMGWTAGLLFKPSENSSIGLNVRSGTEFEFEGTATTTPATLDFTHPQAGPLSLPLPTGGIAASLNTPLNVTLGFALQGEKTTYVADIQWVGWSSYDTLAVDFTEYREDPMNPASPLLRTAAPREYKNTYIFRLGMEHEMSDNFMLRGGILYDVNPVADKYVEPTLPDADRLGLNLGFGYKLTDNMSIDVAYMFLIFMEREITNSALGAGYPDPYDVPLNGTYNSYSHLLGVNFSYQL